MKKRKYVNGGISGFGSYKGERDEPIEPVYPLEEALLAGPVGKGIGRAARELELLTRPKVVNQIHPYLPGRNTKTKYVQRYVKDPAELEHIKETGYMVPKTGVKAKDKKYFTAVDDVKPGPNETLRIPKEKVPDGRAVRRKDVERFNKETEAWEPLKKGGVVKVRAAQRGDGCAKRGKTKGKFR